MKDALLGVLQELGYEEPTPVQRQAVPALLAGKDVLGQAATGTGKTAAFALPLLHRLTPGQCGPFEASALVVVPTRELAMQVAEAMHTYGRKLGVSVLPLYGGQEIAQQLRHLKRGVDVAIVTPGRALDHVRRRSLKLGKVEMVVLDEADEMLDLGFADDLEALLGELPEARQTALFSATLPPRIAAIAERYLDKPMRIRIEPERTTGAALPKIRQVAYVAPRGMKELALGRILDVEAPRSAIIFCRTRLEVDRLCESLAGHGYDTAPLHGGLSQEQRDRTLKRFKAHKLELLIATDVAARGLDVESLSHVINFDLPTSPESYVHRIGRTGRAGKEGLALTLLEPKEHRLLKNIERHTRQKVEVAQIPTLVDLRARRLELTRATVEELLKSGQDLGPFRGAVERLAAERDVLEVAAGALAALHAALNPGGDEEAEQELPPAHLPDARAGAPARGRGEGPARGPSRNGAPTRPGAPTRGVRSKDPGEAVRRGSRLYVGIGRSAGLRPGDLVGAIANEAGISAGDIGAIEILDTHAFVEVVEEHAERVMAALRGSSIRGRKVRVDRDRRR